MNWGDGEKGEGRINKNNLLSPVSCLLTPNPTNKLFQQTLTTGE
ncbi:MAG: hypothetical protein ACKO2T_18460 [Microcystis aeruginosa]